MDRETYLKSILEQMPRILGLLDRNPSSPNYGCFDRQHWNYAISDISQARKQESALTLAILYNLNDKNNPYKRNNKLIEWVNASISFWCKIQSKNGSFNDLYPNEHSYVATAFSSYAISECLLLLGKKIKNFKEAISTLEKSSNWLSKKHEKTVQNQEAGAAIALHNVFLLTKKEKYKKYAERKIDFLLKSQTKEGWFYEYSGPDTGYLSLTIDYLAKYYIKTKNKKVFNALKKAINFIAYFIHPDGSFSGCYSSRNTEYLIPSGFEIIKKEIPLANSIASVIMKKIYEKKVISPSSLDDKYLLFLGYNYLQAYLNYTYVKNKAILPFQKELEKNFNIAGIYILSNSNFYIVFNYNKGGAYKITFKKNNISFGDSGLTMEYDKNLITSCWDNHNNLEKRANTIEIKSHFYKINKKTITPFKNLLLRSFQLTFGKSEKMGILLKQKLRKYLILKSKKTGVKFSRTLSFGKNEFKVIDTFANHPKIRRLLISKSSFIYGESSYYFTETDFNSPHYLFEDINQKNKRLVRTYNLKGNLVNIELH